MSIKAMAIVWERSKQKGSALLMLLAIADYAKDDGTGAWPSLATLARKTRMGRRNAIEVVKKLEADGELIVHESAGPRGCNLYDIICPSEAQFTTSKTKKKLVNPNAPGLVNLDSPGLVNPSSPNPSCIHHESVMPAGAQDPDGATFLPTVEQQMDLLFPKNGSDLREYLTLIKRAGWRITGDIEQAAALFIRASGLSVPFDKDARSDWRKSLEIHVKAYGLEKLRDYYPRVVREMLAGELTVSRPGSVTKNMAALEGKDRNGKPSARNLEPYTPAFLEE